MSESTEKPTVTRDHLAGVLTRYNVAKTKAIGSRVLDLVIEVIGAALRDGNAVHLKGFGRFSVVEVPAQMRRNPKTGAPVAVPARQQVKFKPSAYLLKGVAK